jgi:polyphosphate kinase 2 (PPK2 family)
MFDSVDLNQKLSKTKYKRLLPVLSAQLAALQKVSWDTGVPLIILFEGWDAAGKGTTIQRLTRPLDPRGYKLYPVKAARPHEKRRPWLWRFWRKLPPRGEWAIFDRSWYGRVMVERVEKLIPENEWRRAYRDIVEFERTLIDDGYLIIKFFLHISKDEQRRRFNKLSKNKDSAWHVTEEDWSHHRHYADWFKAYEEVFERTNMEWCPWEIIGANNRRFTRISVCETVVTKLSQRLNVDIEPILTEEAEKVVQENPIPINEEDNPTQIEWGTMDADGIEMGETDLHQQPETEIE